MFTYTSSDITPVHINDVISESSIINYSFDNISRAVNTVNTNM